MIKKNCEISAFQSKYIVKVGIRTRSFRKRPTLWGKPIALQRECNAIEPLFSMNIFIMATELCIRLKILIIKCSSLKLDSRKMTI